MRITNWKLLESIETAITEYNNQLWREEDKNLKLDGLEYDDDWESAEVPTEILKKLKTLRISLIAKDTSPEELEDIINQLSRILDEMDLTLFNFSMNSRGNQTSNVNLSFLDHLNENVKNFSLTGVDLSQETSSLFTRFKSLDYFSLQKCNISNPSIISEINPDVIVSLERNTIAPEHYKKALELIKTSRGRVKFSNRELQTITRNIFYRSNKIK